MRPHLEATLAGILLTAVTAGCEPSGRETASPGAGAGDTAAVEATSLLGEPLHQLPLDSASRTAMAAQLDSAEAARAANPDSADAMIWVGRRLGYLGRYRDAIDVFTDGIAQHANDARFYRHRGHRFISVRELERAIQDLETAARLVSGERDEVEPDGQPNAAGVPRSTLHTNIWYHLALARYLSGDFDGAARDFRRGYELSPNDDMRVAMADWLWLALTRLGRHDEAAALLAPIAPHMDVLENDAYHRRLLMYKGEVSPDSLLPGDDATPLQLATYGYGLGAYHLLRGDTAAATTLFDRVLATGYWPAFGYIASEAELARVRGAGAGTSTAAAPTP